MKKFFIYFVAIIFSIVAAAAITVLLFVPKDPVLDSLPKCERKEYYSSGGFQDSTDYAKYTYGIDESIVSGNELLQPVTQEDISTILDYVNHFEGVVDISQDFPSESYDFDKSVISEGDYFFISNHYEEPERAFWNYNLYYFDMDASILYYFQNNI